MCFYRKTLNARVAKFTKYQDKNLVFFFENASISVFRGIFEAVLSQHTFESLFTAVGTWRSRFTAHTISRLLCSCGSWQGDAPSLHLLSLPGSRGENLGARLRGGGGAGSLASVTLPRASRKVLGLKFGEPSRLHPQVRAVENAHSRTLPWRHRPERGVKPKEE